jgi:hypothetical protein
MTSPALKKARWYHILLFATAISICAIFSTLLVIPGVLDSVLFLILPASMQPPSDPGAAGDPQMDRRSPIGYTEWAMDEYNAVLMGRTPNEVRSILGEPHNGIGTRSWDYAFQDVAAGIYYENGKVCMLRVCNKDERIVVRSQRDAAAKWKSQH